MAPKRPPVCSPSREAAKKSLVASTPSRNEREGEDTTPTPSKKSQTGVPCTADGRECTWTPEKHDCRCSFEKQVPEHWDFKVPCEDKSVMKDLTGANKRYGMPSMIDLMGAVKTPKGFESYVTEEYNIVDIPKVCPQCHSPLTSCPSHEGVIRCNRRKCRKERESGALLYTRTPFLKGPAKESGGC